jgi:hypothetical protein
VDLGKKQGAKPIAPWSGGRLNCEAASRCSGPPRGWATPFFAAVARQRCAQASERRRLRGDGWAVPTATNRRNFLAPPTSETIRITVHARYCTPWLSDLRIDVADGKDKSIPAELCTSRRLHEAQAATEQRNGRLAVYSVRSRSHGTKGDSIRTAIYLYDQRSMSANRPRPHEALRADRRRTSCNDKRRTPAIGCGAFTSITPRGENLSVMVCD